MCPHLIKFNKLHMEIESLMEERLHRIELYLSHSRGDS
jgi:hypothetical protein